MSKTLDIKKLAKDMSLQDKAKLLFADSNKRIETAGVESLLTPKEREAIFEDARKNNQTKELNRLYKLFELMGLIQGDIRTAYLNFGLAEYKLEQVLTAIIITEKTEDILKKLINDLAKGDKEKIKELEKKYLDEFYWGGFFTWFSSDNQVNIGLQNRLIEVVERIKQYKKVRYYLNYLVEVAGIDFLGDELKQELKKFDEDLEKFIEFEDPPFFLKAFRETFLKYKTKGDVRAGEEFYNAIIDMRKTTELTAQEQQRAKEKIDDIISYIL